jgi:hypothetical protein
VSIGAAFEPPIGAQVDPARYAIKSRRQFWI